MNCRDIEELSPLFLSGELVAEERRRFDRHLDNCASCADTIRSARLLDQRLRTAYGTPPPQPARWAALAAVTILAIMSGRQTPRIFDDAARDHRTEVSNHAPRRWKTSDSDVNALFVRFGRAQGPLSLPGYRLLRAKFCGLAGKRVLHLVYTDGRAEYSVYLTGDEVPDQELREASQSIAGFGKGIVVTDGSGHDCRRLAQAAAAVL
jgi:hypothetical protein